MNRRSSLRLAAALWLTVSALSFPEAAGQAPARGDDVQRAVLDRYCVTCHSARAKSGGLVLEKIDLADVAAHGDTWEKVVRKVRAGMMPPPGMPAPPDADKQALLTSLTSQLDRAAWPRRSRGATSVHRLNRTEYANAIRDLLDLEIPCAAAAARRLGGRLRQHRRRARPLTGAARALPRRPPAASALWRSATRRHRRQARFTACARTRRRTGTSTVCRSARGAGSSHATSRSTASTRSRSGCSAPTSTMRGSSSAHHSSISVDGQRVHLASLGGDRDVRGSSEPDSPATEIDNRMLGPRAAQGRPAQDCRRLHREEHGCYAPGSCSPFLRTTWDPVELLRANPHIETLVVTGPFAATGPGETPSRRRVFSCRPSAVADEEACARRFWPSLARRAYRRPLTDADTRGAARLLRGEDARRGRSTGHRHGRLRVILASPDFILADRARSGGRSLPDRVRRADRIWSWRLGCRSSCGAAFRTTSCSRRRAAAS